MYTIPPNDTYLRSILDNLDDYKAAFIAPRIRNKNLILAAIMNSDVATYYVALDSEHSTLSSFVKGFSEACQTYSPRFGTQAIQAAESARTAPQTIAESLIADLGKAKPKPRRIILDNLDFLPFDEDVTAFFHYFVPNLPQGTQLIVNGRHIAYATWMPLVASNHVLVIGDELAGRIFAPKTLNQPHLEVYSLAGGSVFVNGLPMNTWDGPLPRNLFHYFIDNPLVTRGSVFETFWPTLPVKEATNVFHVTKRKISERLGYELTAYSSGFYRPSDQMVVHYDVATFEKTVETNKLNASSDPEAWYPAIRLYRSHYLNRYDMPWMIKRREVLRGLYADALIGLGRAYAEHGDKDQAISVYLRALQEVPEREDIHRDLMKFYNERGEREQALTQFRVLSTILDKNLKLAPSKATQKVYESIKG
ncbi:MAG TPA: bacterial transcriptional activator domain-containing protein [Aggregatilineales bacterium]|nr:hypothetical protein [Anaerolineales bacterium]HRE48905.1 bacterial transcriptional activator domain-containing protein [Aggregatilineales bacterium]